MSKRLQVIIDDTEYRSFKLLAKQVLQAKELVLAYSKISARDALHIAMMNSYRIATIVSFDTGFDHFSEIERIPK